MTRQKTESTPQAPNVQRTSAGLREALFDELDNLRNGKTNPAKANSVAKLADGIIETVRMELDVHRALEKFPKGSAVPPTLGAPIALGA